MAWPKQKMQPSAPFTTDWMTSATVPEHTSACEKHRKRTVYYTATFKKYTRHTETKAKGNRIN